MLFDLSSKTHKSAFSSCTPSAFQTYSKPNLHNNSFIFDTHVTRLQSQYAKCMSQDVVFVRRSEIVHFQFDRNILIPTPHNHQQLGLANNHTDNDI